MASFTEILIARGETAVLLNLSVSQTKAVLEHLITSQIVPSSKVTFKALGSVPKPEP